MKLITMITGSLLATALIAFTLSTISISPAFAEETETEKTEETEKTQNCCISEESCCTADGCPMGCCDVEKCPVVKGEAETCVGADCCTMACCIVESTDDEAADESSKE